MKKSSFYSIVPLVALLALVACSKTGNEKPKAGIYRGPVRVEVNGVDYAAGGALYHVDTTCETTIEVSYIGDTVQFQMPTEQYLAKFLKNESGSYRSYSKWTTYQYEAKGKNGLTYTFNHVGAAGYISSKKVTFEGTR